MANLPKVLISFSNGNLLQDVKAIDGVAGLVGTGNNLKNVPTQVFSLKDAENKGYTADAEPHFHRHLAEFYAEVGGNQPLWVMLIDDCQTMTYMLTDSNNHGAKLLTDAAQGTIRLLGITRTPQGGYDPGANFIDADVETAVTAASAFGDNRLAELAPLRILIEGRVVLANIDAASPYQPSTGACNYAAVVLGGSQNDGSASVGTVLGRAVKYAADIKVGKVANGPTQLTNCYIGTRLIWQVPNLDTLHGYGYLSFLTYRNKAGYYIGIDRMANTADYRLLAFGRVVDKVAVIAAAVYTEQLESEVNLTPAGKISPVEARHLQDTIENQVNTLMADQLSSFSTYIDLTQDVLNTSTLAIRLSVIPKGYTSEIDIDLGLAAPTS